MDDSEVDSLSSTFERIIEKNPNKVALYLPERPRLFSAKAHKKYTYKELGEASDRIAFALERAGVERKMRAVLLLNPSFEFFAMVIAMFKIGVVPVFLNPRIGLKQLSKCIQEVKPDIFIGNTLTFMIKPFLGLEKDSIKINIVGGIKIAVGAITLKALIAKAEPKKKYHSIPLEPEDQAAIMFTSGGTGRPKGVIYTYRNLLTQFKVIQKTYDIGSDLIDMPTLIFFSFFDLSRGLSVVVPDTGLLRPASVDPKMILDIINEFEVTMMFASPALVERLGLYAERNNLKIRTLKKVITAGAPAKLESLNRIKRILPEQAEIHIAYGATECLPITTISRNELLEIQSDAKPGAGICIGTAIESISIIIIRISEMPIPNWDESLRIPPGEIGEIIVLAGQASTGYFNLPQEDQKSKIRDGHGNVFHRTGDLGYFDNRGYLWFVGRKSHRVDIEDKTLFSIPFEQVLDLHPQVRRTALIGVDTKGKVLPTLVVELKKPFALANRERLRSELFAMEKEQLKSNYLRKIFFHSSLPVDMRHNSKILREKLVLWAMKKKR